MSEVRAELAALAAANQALLGTLAAVDDARVSAPSLLPGWTVGHVLTHIARNGDGVRNQLEGAARGETRDQYPHGPEGRAADIEAGAGRSAQATTDDVRASIAALDQAIGAMPAAAWDCRVRAFAGEYPAAHALVSRCREVLVHHVDLGMQYRPPDWPAEFVAAELDLAVAGLPQRLPAGTALRLVTDEGVAWEVGEGPASLSVAGPGGWLLAWLIGRPVPASALHTPAGLPHLGKWR